MKKILKNFFFGVVPVVALVLLAVWHKRNSDRAIEYEKNFQLLKTTCQDSAGKDGKADESISEYVTGICGCFAKSALKHRSISVAGIVSDQDIVHAILRDCARRVPTSQK